MMALNTPLLAVLLSIVTSSVFGQVANVSSVPAQVINGIGASGAWWPNDLISFPDSVREQVAELLFDSSASSGGAGLTSYRYNVGGGGVFVGNPTRAPETFYVSPGVYNWSADAAGVYFLKQAAAYNVPVITAFVNSAPPAFTSNNRSCGGTIVDDQIPAYAQYLADVVSHWTEEGIGFTHVSPMNEPDNSFSNGDTTPCGQEGMLVTPEQRASVVNAVRSALDAANLTSVGIMADESSSASSFISEAPTWMPNASSSLAATSHHLYGFADDATVAQMGETGRNLSGKETWSTEICCFAASSSSESENPAAQLTYSQVFDPTMVGGLQLGQLIYQSFTQTLDAHFDFWTALSSAIGCSPLQNQSCQTSVNSDGWNDGLIYYDPDFATNSDFTLYTTKRYYVFKHFSRFVFLGATRFDVSGLPDSVFGLVFKSDETQQTELGSATASFILMNMGTTTATVDFSQAGLGTPIGGVITDFEYDWQDGSVGNSVALPALSIVTLLFK